MDKYYKQGEQLNGYDIIKFIGQGRYGIVYLAINNNSEKVIIKQLKEAMLEETKKKLFYEEKILQKLDDSKFPKCISSFNEHDVQGYILSYIEGIVFEDLLYRYKFNRNQIYTIASQLIEIVDILQQNNIVHRDIRPPNIIVKENSDLVLIDFGLARFIDNKRYVKEIDYWYIGDFLIHLYYTSYNKESTSEEEKPWFEELDLNNHEKYFLKKLMGIDGRYKNTDEIRKDLDKIKTINE